jgi:TPR repeat protein
MRIDLHQTLQRHVTYGALFCLSVWLTLLLSPVPARAQNFELGLEAFNAGDYDEALSHWRPLSTQGDAKAQAALGYLYFKGLGVARDGAVAARWLLPAAERGQPTAQALLGVLYLEGRGVERDPALAFMWCDLAMTYGFTDALDCRDEAGGMLSLSEAERAHHLIAQWLGAHPGPGHFK